MALHMQLMVGRDAIGLLVIQREAPVNPRPDVDAVCTYRWSVELHNHVARSLPGEPVEHRYGDSPWVLVAKVLAAAGYHPGCVPAGASVEEERG
jgi:hypothetical protein